MPNQEIFQKTKINELMRTVLKRLRTHKINVPDILLALHHEGFDIDRSQFETWFTTRPEVDRIAPIPVFVAVINLAFRYDTRILSAAELLQLLNAARMPLDVIQSFSHFFPSYEWHGAMKAYGVSVSTATEHLVGRDAMVHALYEGIVHHKSVVLTGPAGIGKTAIALHLMQRFHIDSAQPTYFVDGRAINGVMQLHDGMAEAFRLKPMGMEPIIFRVQSFVADTAPRIIIDDFGEHADFSCGELVGQLQAHFPNLTYIITSSHIQAPQQIVGARLIVVPSLDFVGEFSSAAHLVRRHVKSSGLPLLHTSLIDAICQQAQGNPRQLTLMTDIIARDHTALVHEDVLIQTLAQSDPVAQRMLMTLVLLKFKVSTRFLYAVNPVVFAIPEATLGEYLAQLRLRGLVTVINDDNDNESYMVPEFVRDYLTVNHTVALMRDVLWCLYHAFTCDDYDEVHPSSVHRHLVYHLDLGHVLDLGRALLQAGMPMQSITLLCLWQDHFIHHGLVVPAIMLGEQAFTFVQPGHPLYTELRLTMTVLYHERGLAHLSAQHLVYVHAQCADTDGYLRARMALVQSLVVFHSVRTADDAQFALLRDDLFQAARYFERTNLRPWLAHTYDYTAYLYFCMGQLREAHEYINKALEVFRKSPRTNWMTESMRLYGLILITVGDYDLARQQLTDVLHQYTANAQLSEIANSHIRLAVLNVLTMQIREAARELCVSVGILARIGGLNDIMYSIDIYCGILFGQGAFADAQIVLALNDRWRHERQLFRGDVFDAMLQQFKTYASNNPAIATQTLGIFHPRMTINELTHVMHRQLQLA